MINKLLDCINESPTVFFILKKENYSWELDYVTSNVLNFYGVKSEDFLSKKVKHEDFIHKDDFENYKTELKQISKARESQYTYKSYRLVNNNKIVWVNHIIKKLFDKEGKISSYYGYITDVSESQKVKKELDARLSIINDNVLISITDEKGIIIDVSDAYCKLTKYTKEELLGKNHNIFRHPKTKDDFFLELWNTIVKGNIWKGEHLNLKKDSSEFWVENSITPNYDENKNIIGYTSIYNDITDKKRISELSITDYLTGLYNRRHFSTIFDLELKRAKRNNRNLILMILDIDFFKQYNDTYGHDGGDVILKRASDALNNTLHRSQDTLFRLGGEEFAVITSEIDYVGTLALTNKLLQSITDLKIEHKNSNVNKYLTISIGVQIVNFSNNWDETKIYKLADGALYEAKEKGRNQAIIKV